MQTAGQFTQDTPFNDAQILISATDFQTSGATPAQGLATVGTAQVPSVFGTVAGTFTAVASVSGQILRTGNFPPSTLQTMSSQAFGTAAALPGPQAAVPATSSPSGFGISSVVPPVPKASLATVIGSVPGAKPKGIQINWVDWLYQPTGTPAATLTGAMNLVAQPVGVNLAAVITTLMSAQALNTAAVTAGRLNRFRTTPTVIQMLTADGSLVNLTFTCVIAAGVSVLFCGCILGCSFNYN